MYPRSFRPGVLAVALVAACRAPGPPTNLIFADGRAVATAGDSLFAFTRPGQRGIFVQHRHGSRIDTLGAAVLASPFQVQELDGRWYVSDVEDGHASIAVLSSVGALERRISVDTIASAPHQFAVLPDGRIVVEAVDGRLVAVAGDTVRTFALAERSSRTGLVVAGLGGVLHAVPDRSITLYNRNGNIRWRLEWPWQERAFVADLAVDANGRFHVLAGEEGRNTFVVFTLSPTNGDVMRWSVPGPYASFVVDRMGLIRPDTGGRY